MLVDSVRQPCASAGIRCQARHDRQSQLSSPTVTARLLANDSDAESSLAKIEEMQNHRCWKYRSETCRPVADHRKYTTKNNYSHKMSMVIFVRRPPHAKINRSDATILYNWQATLFSEWFFSSNSGFFCSFHGLRDLKGYEIKPFHNQEPNPPTPHLKWATGNK